MIAYTNANSAVGAYFFCTSVELLPISSSIPSSFFESQRAMDANSFLYLINQENDLIFDEATIAASFGRGMGLSSRENPHKNPPHHQVPAPNPLSGQYNRPQFTQNTVADHLNEINNIIGKENNMVEWEDNNADEDELEDNNLGEYDLEGYRGVQGLEKYGRDMVERVGKLDPVIGRDDEIRRVIRILSRRTKNNPV